MTPTEKDITITAVLRLYDKVEVKSQGDLEFIRVLKEMMNENK